MRSATLPKENRLARPCPTAPRTTSPALNFVAAVTNSSNAEPEKNLSSTLVPSSRKRCASSSRSLRLCKIAASSTTGLEVRAPSNSSTWMRTRLVSSRLAIAAAMSTASVAVAEKSIPQTIGRLVILFFPFICSVFVDVLRLRQGVIDTFKQPSRRDPKTSYASTIWSSLNLCVSSGSGSKRFDCTIDISRRIRSFPPGQSVVTIL